MVYDMLKAQGWLHLFHEKVEVDVEQVRKFYDDFILITNPKSGALSGASEVEGEQVLATPKIISGLLEIPSVEIYFDPNADLTAVRKASSLRLFGRDLTSIHTSELTRDQRIAHLVIVKAVLPRFDMRSRHLWDRLHPLGQAVSSRADCVGKCVLVQGSVN